MVGAKLVADIAHIAGLVAAGLHPSPVPYADIITSTTHKTLRGPRGGFILCRQELARAIDSAVFPGLQGGPLMHVVVAKAIVFKEAMQPEFLDYQKAILDNARVLAEELKAAGLRLVSGGTDNHLILVDLSKKGITGKAAEEALGRTGIVVNRNTVPFVNKQSASIANGIRLGTPAVTSRGFGAVEMKKIASWIIKVMDNIDDKKLEKQVAAEILELCQKFPVPGIDE
jgi:glycine hydroxymethyltransferase